jgi:hypothetical protein
VVTRNEIRENYKAKRRGILLRLKASAKHRSSVREYQGVFFTRALESVHQRLQRILIRHREMKGQLAHLAETCNRDDELMRSYHALITHRIFECGGPGLASATISALENANFQNFHLFIFEDLQHHAMQSQQSETITFRFCHLRLAAR